MIELTDEEAVNICKIGQAEKTCIYLVLSGKFACAYATDMQTTLDTKYIGMTAQAKGGWEGCKHEKELGGNNGS